MNIPTQDIRMQGGSCAHKGCLCTVSDGQSCCGPYCSAASVDIEPRNDTGRCECGHALCSKLADDRLLQP